MLKTLRNRLILSHILPVLFITPLMGIALIYALETRILIPNLVRALTGEAMLFAEVTREQADIWNNANNAQTLLQNVSPALRTRVMLISTDGRLLASSDPLDNGREGQIINVPGIEMALKGEVQTHTNYYSQTLGGEIIDVLAPVIDNNGQVIGMVRMSYRYATLADDFLQLRYLISGIVIFGLLLGAVLGYILALSIGNPVRRVTGAVFSLARGTQGDQLSEQGPEEIRVLLQAVNFLVERLNNLEKARRQLLANIVHELGRPLGALRSAIQALIQGAYQDAELRDELLEGMDGETARLQHLLEDLAHLHDQVLGILELERRPIKLATWLSTILRTWQEAAHDKRIRWRTEIPPDLPTIQADPVRLAQAIGNLTSNAIKFTPVSGSVTISAGTTEEEVWIEVSDTGPGISEEEQENIFTPFYRGNSQGRRFPQGMGLGLSIARDLVAAHSGHLEIQSAPGLGSRFIIWLPRQLPEPSQLSEKGSL
jgi:two-component system sensor histidine kinase BaeS